MKKIFFLLFFAALFVVGCNKEPMETLDNGPEVQFATVPITLGTEGEEPGSRSQLTISTAEAFYKATLFAFWHNTNSEKGQVAGNIVLNGNQPCVITTTTASFDWPLPLNEAIDIYAVVNYGSMDLSTYTSNTSLTATSLANNLVFTCTRSGFLNLDNNGYGIPMEGTLENKTLVSANDVITIKAKKLFARYDFYADLTGWDSGTFQCIQITGVKSNMEVPFFQEGYRQTDPNKLTTLDSATSADLQKLNSGGSSNLVTIYLPENCQGTKNTSHSWKEWGVMGVTGSSELALCSYVDFQIIRNSGYNHMEGEQLRVYLGTDLGMNQSNFDVIRNKKQTIGLQFTDDKWASSLKIDHEGDVYLPSTGSTILTYRTKGISSPSEISNLSDVVQGVSVTFNNDFQTSTSGIYTHKGTITITTNNATVGKAFVLKLGNLSRGVSDSKNAAVFPTDVVFEGENAWYMPGTTLSDYMELTSTTAYSLNPSNFSSLEVCLYGGTADYLASYYQSNANGFVPCTTEFVPDGTGKYYIKVKCTYSAIQSNYNAISNGFYKCRGTMNAIKARILDSNNNYIYFNLGTCKIHLGLAVVSRPVYASTRTQINGWDDDIFFVPTVYSDKFTDNARWSFDDNDFDAEQGNFYMPVGVTNIQEYTQVSIRVYLTQKFASSNVGAAGENLSYAPYKNYLVSSSYCSGVSNAAAAFGGCHGPSLTLYCWGGLIGGDPADLRDSAWYSNLENMADRPNNNYKGNLSNYKISWQLFNKVNNTAVADGGYFDYDTPIYNGLTQQCWLRFHDAAVDLCDVDMDDLLQ